MNIEQNIPSDIEYKKYQRQFRNEFLQLARKYLDQGMTGRQVQYSLEDVLKRIYEEHEVIKGSLQNQRGKKAPGSPGKVIDEMFDDITFWIGVDPPSDLSERIEKQEKYRPFKDKLQKRLKRSSLITRIFITGNRISES